MYVMSFNFNKQCKDQNNRAKYKKAGSEIERIGFGH